MAPAASSPLLKLFGVDRSGPGGSLQHVRDKIYSHVWSRVRRDDHKLDFVISETGINRNVPERLLEDPFGRKGALLVPPPACNLHLVNRQLSRDFTRYIYTLNDLEVDLDLKTVQTDQGQGALDKVIILLKTPNFQKYTRTARLRIHFPSEYPIADLPTFNQTALDNIAFAFDDFKNLDHLAIRIVPSQGVPLDYELRLAAFSFYPMHMTNWSIRILNTAAHPYTWDIVDAQTVVLLDKAHQVYLETGKLTAPIFPSLNKQPLKTSTSNVVPKAKPNGDKPCGLVVHRPSHDFVSAAINGSQKKRERKKKAVAALKAAADDAAQAAAGVEATSDNRRAVVVNVKAEASTALLAEAEVAATGIYPAVYETGARLEDLHPQDIVRLSSTVLPSPPPSPTHNEIRNMLSSSPTIGPAAPSPAKSAAGYMAVEDINEGPSGATTAEDFELSSQAASSVTLGRLDQSLMIDDVEDLVHRADNASVDDANSDGTTALGPQTKKKRRNRKGKKSKSQSKTIHSNSLDAESEAEEVQLVEHRETEDPNTLHLRPNQVYTVQSFSAKLNSYSYDELSRGLWEHLTSGHILFTHPDTGDKSIHSRDARIDRYVHQQDRRNAAQAVRAETPKPAKIKSLRKARQVLLRRDHVAANSLLSRAMHSARSRDISKKQSDSELQPVPPEISHDMSVSAQMDLYQRRTESDRELRQLKLKAEVNRVERVDFVDGSDAEFDSAREAVAHRFGFRHNEYSDGDSTASNTEDTPSPMFVPHTGNIEGSQGSDTGERSDLQAEENAVVVHKLQQDSQLEADGRVSDGHGTTSAEGKNFFQLYPEYGISQQPVQSDDIVNDFVEPRVPICIRMPSNHNPAQDSRDHVSPGQESLLLPATETGELAAIHFSCEAAHHANDDDEDPSENVRLQRRRGRGCGRDRGRGRGRGRDRVHGVRDDRKNYNLDQKGNGPSRGGQRGGYRPRPSDESTARTPLPIVIRLHDERQSAWVSAAQAKDQDISACNKQERLAMEEEMRVNGTSYEDYASQIEDNHTRLDEDGKAVPEKSETIVYGPRSQCVAPSMSPEPELETETAIMSENVEESRDSAVV